LYASKAPIALVLRLCGSPLRRARSGPEFVVRPRTPTGPGLQTSDRPLAEEQL